MSIVAYSNIFYLGTTKVIKTILETGIETLAISIYSALFYLRNTGRRSFGNSQGQQTMHLLHCPSLEMAIIIFGKSLLKWQFVHVFASLDLSVF